MRAKRLRVKPCVSEGLLYVKEERWGETQAVRLETGRKRDEDKDKED